MGRFFNTAGLCFPEDHYIVDPLRRLKNIEDLIHEKKYFIVHAPRQTGKTTAMRTLMKKLNGEGTYIALHVSFETASVTGDNYQAGNLSITKSILWAAEDQLPEQERPSENFDSSDPSHMFYSLLRDWANAQKKPIILLIDEIDSLSDLTLISILRQLRDGYQSRPQSFPQSIALIGLKDVREYKIKIRNELTSMGTASPFNIKDESLTLRNFYADEVTELYLQHTNETGQKFTEEALDLAYYYSQGQPWLTCALAKECAFRGPKARTKETIDADDIRAAKEKIILRRDTHIDSLMDKLNEERVQKILAPILKGEMLGFDITNDDLVYARDLGLIKTEPGILIANPIYQEVIPRSLNYKLQVSIPAEVIPWTDSEGKLDWLVVWDNFLEFWREHGSPLIEAAWYPEIAPHLVLMAYLQRIANSRGEIIREYAIGRGRMDILVRWPYVLEGKKLVQREAIELKVWKQGRPDPLQKGLDQLNKYLEGLSLTSGTLIIFDRREDLLSVEERTTREFMEYKEKMIQLIRG